MNWKIGDRAIVLRSHYPDRLGLIVTIMSELIIGPHKAHGENTPYHFVDAPSRVEGFEYAAIRPQDLGPLHYDGNETTSWDECPFKPKELVIV